MVHAWGVRDPQSSESCCPILETEVRRLWMMIGQGPDCVNRECGHVARSGFCCEVGLVDGGMMISDIIYHFTQRASEGLLRVHCLPNTLGMDPISGR